MRTNIKINEVKRESEKAILVNLPVYFSANASKPRDMWFPKSVCEIVDANMLAVDGWFLVKASEQNAFKGYEMHFVEA